MIPIKGYCTFDPLKTAIVGDVFPIEKFKHIREDKVLSPLPLTIAVNEVLVPLHTELPEPILVMVGANFVTNTALELVTLPHPLVAINE